jgi:hypothetical protein
VAGREHDGDPVENLLIAVKQLIFKLQDIVHVVALFVDGGVEQGFVLNLLAKELGIGKQMIVRRVVPVQVRRITYSISSGATPIALSAASSSCSGRLLYGAAFFPLDAVQIAPAGVHEILCLSSR